MQRGSTIFLGTVIILSGLVMVALCIFALPALVNEMGEMLPNLAYLKLPFLICLYAAAVVFLFAMYQSLKLLGYVNKRTFFSETSLNSLKNIKHSAIVESVILYLAGMPVIFLLAELDDAPGLVLFGLAFASAPLVAAAFVSVLQKLLQEAIDIKSGNPFTIE